MDPKLAERFKRQQEKEELGDELRVAEIGSAADTSKQLDPVLAKRWAKQRELQESGAEALDEIGSAAKQEKQLDPMLQKRWSKLEAGEVEVKEIGSVATVSTKVDPVLAKRWAKQQEFAESGRNWDDPEKSSIPSAVNPELAGKFAKHRQKLQLEEFVTSQDSAAARQHIQLRARSRREVAVPWPEEATQLARIRWSGVVLGDLDAELEVVAELRPDSDRSRPEIIVLQRAARGETFIGDFCPGRDRRCLRAGAEGGGSGASAPAGAAAAPAPGGSEASSSSAAGQELTKRDFKEVDRLVFKFSNAYSWLTAKDVELVTLFE